MRKAVPSVFDCQVGFVRLIGTIHNCKESDMNRIYGGHGMINISNEGGKNLPRRLASLAGGR